MTATTTADLDVMDEKSSGLGLMDTVPGHRLVSVLVFHRHGERTPTSALYNEATEERFYQDKIAFNAREITNWDEVQRCLERGTLVDDFDTLTGTDRSAELDHEFHIKADLPDWCGLMTNNGLNEMKKLGEWLRKRYVNEYKFLSPQFEPPMPNSSSSSSSSSNSTKLTVYSTNSMRTILSADWVLQGLYPDLDETDPKIDIQINADRNKLTCVWYASYRRIRSNYELYKQEHPESDVMQEQRWNEIRNAYPYDKTEPPKRLHTKLDPILVRHLTSEDLPPDVEMEEKMRDIAVEYCKRQKFLLGNTREDLKKSSGGMFRYIQQFCAQSSEQMVIVSAHDTTLLPILLGMEQDEPEMPGFAKPLIFEVYEDEETGARLLKVLYGYCVHMTEKHPFDIERISVAEFNMRINDVVIGQT